MRTRTYDFREEPPNLTPDAGTPSRRMGLRALVLAIVASAALLYALGGPPHPPVRPDLHAIVAGLRSADPHLAGTASWCFALAWALWLWTVGSLLAQALLLALVRATGGAGWVLALRPAIAPLLMPLARRALPVLTAGVILARLATSSPPGTAAAPAPIVLALPGSDLPRGSSGMSQAEGVPGPIEHTVVEGDTLWALAERYYGDGELFPVLHEANLGLPMPDGTRYEGQLHPGQVLVVPSLAPAATSPEDQFVYTVEGGDTLRAIAARFLGDEMRWPEIFALNRGVAALPDGRTLADPDLIWPGLALVIPTSPPAASPMPGAGGAPPPAAPPSTPPVSAPPSPVPSPPPAPVLVTPAPSTPTPAPLASASPIPVSQATPVPTRAAPVGATPPVASPTPAATVIAPPRPAAPEVPALQSPGRAPLVASAGALGVALAGGAVFLRRRQLLARRELRRQLRAATPASVAIRTVREEEAPGFADGDLLGTLTHRAYGGEVEPAVALAHHAARFFAEESLAAVTPLLMAQGARGDATLLVGGPRAAREQVVALAPALGTLLGGGGRALPVRGTGDVEMRLTGLTAAGLLAPPAGPTDIALPTVLPLAELPGGMPLFANWDALENVLVAGGPGEGADVALTSLVATLASRRHPDTLRLWAIARQQALPPELFALPHWGDPRVDPDDRARVNGLLADLRTELDRRREEPPDTSRPDLVLILAEVANVIRRDDATVDTMLGLLALDGPRHGIRLIAATARPDNLDDGALRLFDTRLVLRLADEAQSVRLLGISDATALPGGGRLLLRLAGRKPRPFAGVSPGRARGYRIAPEALTALAEQLRRLYCQTTELAGMPRPANDDLSESVGAVAMGDHPSPEKNAVGGGEDSDGVSGRDSEAATDNVDAPAASPAGSAQVAGLLATRAPARNGSNGTPVDISAGSTSTIADSAPSLSVCSGNGAPEVRNAPGDAVDDEEQGAGGGPIPASDHSRAPMHGQHVDTSEQPGCAHGAIAASNGSTASGTAFAVVQPREELAAEPSATTPPNGASRRIVDLAITDGSRAAARAAAPAPEAITADLLTLDPGEEPPVATPLDIRCFGPFRVLHAGEQLAPQHHAKAWELLQLLAAYPPRSLTKDRLWSALWPDPDGWPSRNIFNTLVGRLRQELTSQVPCLPREVVQKTRDGECWLDPDLVTVDVHQWLAILKREQRLPLLEALAEYRLARALYRPTLLEGANYEWLAMRDDGVTPAEDYLERWADYRLRLARRCVREGRPDLAVPLYRGMIEDRPREETLVRELFRCYGQTGDLPGLERQMRALGAALREGYGDDADAGQVPVAEQPEQETTAVYRDIKVTLARDRALGADSAGG